MVWVWHDYFMNTEYFEIILKWEEIMDLWVECGDLVCAGDMIGSWVL